jgi:hypothetical protein
MWYDDRPQTPPETKLRAAAEAFRARFQVVPRVAVTNPTQQPGGDVDGMRVVSPPGC